MQISLDSTRERIQEAQDIHEIIQRVFYQKKGELDLHKEHFWVFSLNKIFKILNLELVSMGSKDRTIADPGEVFRFPLYKSSSYVILVHNHPSGSLKPSEADIKLTNRLMKAGDILNVKVIDHVIVTEKSYFSLRDNGIIEKLEFNTEYALNFIYEKKMKRKMEDLKKEVEKERDKGKLEGLREGKLEGRQEGKREGMKQRNVEIARAMLREGEGTEKIIKYTGLSRQWIGRIKSNLDKTKQ